MTSKFQDSITSDCVKMNLRSRSYAISHFHCALFCACYCAFFSAWFARKKRRERSFDLEAKAGLVNVFLIFFSNNVLALNDSQLLRFSFAFLILACLAYFSFVLSANNLITSSQIEKFCTQLS